MLHKKLITPSKNFSEIHIEAMNFTVIPDHVLSFDIYRNVTAIKNVDINGKKLDSQLSNLEIINIYAIRLDRDTNKTYINLKSYG